MLSAAATDGRQQENTNNKPSSPEKNSSNDLHNVLLLRNISYTFKQLAFSLFLYHLLSHVLFIFIIARVHYFCQASILLTIYVYSNEPAPVIFFLSYY